MHLHVCYTVRTVFKMHVSEREVSNVRGKLGKNQLDPEKIDYIKSVSFRMYPLELAKATWSACVNAINEANRGLNRKKQ